MVDIDITILNGGYQLTFTWGGTTLYDNRYPPVVPKLDTASLDSGIQHHHAAKIGIEDHHVVPVAETSIAMFAYIGDYHVGHAP